MALAPCIPEGMISSLLGSDAEATVHEALDAGFLRSIEDGYEMHPLLRDFLLAKDAALGARWRDRFAEELTRW